VRAWLMRLGRTRSHYVAWRHGDVGFHSGYAAANRFGASARLAVSRALERRVFLPFMKRRASIIVIAAGLLAGCSSGAATSTPSGSNQGGATKPAAVQSSAAADTSACSGGLKGSEPGVVSITCDGPAEVKITAADITRDLHGGRCQSAGGVWSVTVGVIIDRTGLHGKYAGPQVDSVTVNNTDTAGKATVQATLGGKLYYDLGEAKLTLSADQKTAHVVGVSDHTSDAPKAPITVDVTC